MSINSIPAPWSDTESTEVKVSVGDPHQATVNISTLSMLLYFRSMASRLIQYVENPRGLTLDLTSSEACESERDSRLVAELRKRYGVKSLEPTELPDGFLERLMTSTRATEAVEHGNMSVSLNKIMKRYNGVESLEPTELPDGFLEQHAQHGRKLKHALINYVMYIDGEIQGIAVSGEPQRD